MKNEIIVAGKVLSEPKFLFKTQKDEYFQFFVEVERISGAKDILPIVVPSNVKNQVKEDDFLKINGQIRTCNQNDKLIVNIAGQEIFKGIYSQNQVSIEAYVVKKPVHRTTPLGKDITELLIACNREAGGSDYIPCICWFENAVLSSNFEVGTHIIVSGRLQSREYKKKTNNKTITKTTYELAIKELEVLEDGENNN